MTGGLQEGSVVGDQPSNILNVLGLVSEEGLLHPVVSMQESTSIVCCKLLARSRLPGVAVSH